MKPVVRFLGLVIVALAAGLRGESQPSTPSPTQGSQAWVWESLKFTPNGVGGRREVTNLPTATMRRFESHVTTLRPGVDSHPPHKHAQEEFIILKEGVLETHINGHSQRVGPGSLFFFASNDLHNVSNVGDTPATYLVFNVQTALTASAPAEGAAKAAVPGKLGSTVYDWEALPVTKTAKGARRQLMDSPTITCAHLECHVTTLVPGEAPHAAHRHPDEELIVVKEGLVEATCDGVATRGGPGSIFFFASNALHGLKNVGAEAATYYVVRITTEATPKPAVKE
jgi:quercetin dioxygenase-like cupin family protein